MPPIWISDDGGKEDEYGLATKDKDDGGRLTSKILGYDDCRLTSKRLVSDAHHHSRTGEQAVVALTGTTQSGPGMLALVALTGTTQVMSCQALVAQTATTQVMSCPMPSIYQPLSIQVEVEDRHRIFKKRHTTAWSIKCWAHKALDMFAAVSLVLDGMTRRSASVRYPWRIVLIVMSVLIMASAVDAQKSRPFVAKDTVMKGTLPIPRHSFAQAQAFGMVYVFGGSPNLNDMHVYDDQDNRWSKILDQNGDSRPKGRQGHKMEWSRIGHNLLIVGGKAASMANPSNHRYHLDMFDPSWKSLDTFNFDKRNVIDIWAFSAVTLKFTDLTPKTLPAPAILKPSQIDGTEVLEMGSVPHVRWGSGWAYTGIPGKMVLFGGHYSANIRNFFYADVWEFDYNTLKWDSIFLPRGYRCAFAQGQDQAYGPNFADAPEAPTCDSEYAGFDSNYHGPWDSVEESFRVDYYPLASPGPMGRADPGFAWSGSGSKVLLFGGYTKKMETAGGTGCCGQTTLHSDLWQYEHSTRIWTNLTSSAIGARPISIVSNGLTFLYEPGILYVTGDNQGNSKTTFQLRIIATSSIPVWTELSSTSAHDNLISLGQAGRGLSIFDGYEFKAKQWTIKNEWGAIQDKNIFPWNPDRYSMQHHVWAGEENKILTMIRNQRGIVYELDLNPDVFQWSKLSTNGNQVNFPGKLQDRRKQGMSWAGVKGKFWLCGGSAANCDAIDDPLCKSKCTTSEWQSLQCQDQEIWEFDRAKSTFTALAIVGSERPINVPRGDTDILANNLDSAVTGFAWTGVVGRVIYIENSGTSDSCKHNWFGYGGPGVWEFDRPNRMWTRLEIGGERIDWKIDKGGLNIPSFAYAGIVNKFILRYQCDTCSGFEGIYVLLDTSASVRKWINLKATGPEAPGVVNHWAFLWNGRPGEIVVYGGSYYGARDSHYVLDVGSMQWGQETWNAAGTHEPPEGCCLEADSDNNVAKSVYTGVPGSVIMINPDGVYFLPTSQRGAFPTTGVEMFRAFDGDTLVLDPSREPTLLEQIDLCTPAVAVVPCKFTVSGLATGFKTTISCHEQNGCTGLSVQSADLSGSPGWTMAIPILDISGAVFLNIADSSFFGFSSYSHGSVVRAYNKATVTVKRSRFLHSFSHRSGGCIASLGANLVIADSDFVGCSARIDGGAISGMTYVSYPSPVTTSAIDLVGTHVEYCTAESGGGVHIERGTLALEQSTFIGNQATGGGGGGGIRSIGARMTYSYIVVEKLGEQARINSAPHGGGGFFKWEGGMNPDIHVGCRLGLGGDWCEPCASGHYTNISGSNCTVCPAGTYAKESGSSVCASCPAGAYQDATSASTCMMCKANASSPAGSTIASECHCLLGFGGEAVALAVPPVRQESMGRAAAWSDRTSALTALLGPILKTLKDTRRAQNAPQTPTKMQHPRLFAQCVHQMQARLLGARRPARACAT